MSINWYDTKFGIIKDESPFDIITAEQKEIHEKLFLNSASEEPYTSVDDMNLRVR